MPLREGIVPRIRRPRTTRCPILVHLIPNRTSILDEHTDGRDLVAQVNTGHAPSTYEIKGREEEIRIEVSDKVPKYPSS